MDSKPKVDHVVVIRSDALRTQRGCKRAAHRVRKKKEGWPPEKERSHPLGSDSLRPGEIAPVAVSHPSFRLSPRYETTGGIPNPQLAQKTCAFTLIAPEQRPTPLQRP